MDITPYVESLRRDLLAAAAGAGDEAARTAERLGFALDPAARLAMMEVVSQAAAEITAEMAGGAVDVRLEGRELAFTVHEDVPAPPPAAPAPPAPSAPLAPPTPLESEGVEDGGLSRITLRLPDGVKARADDAAAAAGQSLNTWLVAAVRGALHEGSVHVDVDLSSRPLGAGFDPLGRRSGARRMTGWI